MLCAKCTFNILFVNFDAEASRSNDLGNLLKENDENQLTKKKKYNFYYIVEQKRKKIYEMKLVTKNVDKGGQG